MNENKIFAKVTFRTVKFAFRRRLHLLLRHIVLGHSRGGLPRPVRILCLQLSDVLHELVRELVRQMLEVLHRQRLDGHRAGRPPAEGRRGDDEVDDDDNDGWEDEVVVDDTGRDQTERHVELKSS